MSRREPLQTGIRGVRAEILGQTLIVTSDQPLKVLSSAILNGGFVNAHSIINHRVAKTYKGTRPEKVLEREAKRLGLHEPFVGFLTAVDVKRVALSIKHKSGFRVAVLTTAGLSYPATAGDMIYGAQETSSTINTVVLVDADLTDECLVEAIKTSTEAKTAALRELDVRSNFSKRAATGTTTDAIAVACTGGGERLRFCGTATRLGQTLAQAVHESATEAIRKYEGVTKERPLLIRLQERNISLSNLVEAGMRLYIPRSEAPSKTEVRNMLKREITRALDDKNVSAMIIAAVRLEEDGELGLLPGLSTEEFQSDPYTLVADESLGMAIANYLGGTWGVHNFLYYERNKPSIIGKLGPFLDDAMAGLIAGAFSRLFAEKEIGRLASR